MNKLGLAKVLTALVVTTVLGALPACYGEGPSVHAEALEGEATEAIRSSDSIVGKWQFVLTDSARRGHEARMASEIEDPVELEKAKLAAEKEAAQSQIELTEEGELLSWVEGELLFQAGYSVSDEAKTSLRLTMGPKTTTVTLNGTDEIVIDDPKKGPLTFRRVK